MALKQWIPGPGVLMRKRVWEQCGGYDEILPPYHGNEDWDFWITAVQKGINVRHVPEPLYQYRRAANAVSASSLLYYDHVTRKRIYRRHRRFFKATGQTRSFLAEGFVRSSEASIKRKKRLRASYLAFQGLVIQPTNANLCRLLLLALLPVPLHRTFRSLMTRNAKQT